MKDLIQVPCDDPDTKEYISKATILEVKVRPLEIIIIHKDNSETVVKGTVTDRTAMETILAELEI